MAARTETCPWRKTYARSTMAAAFNPGAQAGLSCLVVGPAGPQRTLMTPSTMQFDVLSIAIGDMPRRWIEYSCFDVVSLSLSELRLLSQSNPEAYQALRRWVRTGGQLWVSDMGAKFEELAELVEAAAATAGCFGAGRR